MGQILTRKISGSSYPLEKDGKKLYCVAVLEFRNGKWKSDFVYMHCDNAVVARADYLRSIQGLRMKYQIIGIAPVLGLKADENGENITV